jgi:hypothetical protein
MANHHHFLTHALNRPIHGGVASRARFSSSILYPDDRAIYCGAIERTTEHVVHCDKTQRGAGESDPTASGQGSMRSSAEFR